MYSSIVLFIACLYFTGNLLKAQLKNEKIHFEGSLMRQMWQTPIMQSSLLKQSASRSEVTVPGIFTTSEIENMAAEIVDYYESFCRFSTQSKNEKIDAATLSDLFYRHQQTSDIQYKQCILSSQNNQETVNIEGTKNECMMNRPSLFYTLMPIFYQAIVHYLEENYLSSPFPVSKYTPLPLNYQHNLLKHLFVWTSLHVNGSYHAPHHHSCSSVSGVFYLQISFTSSSDGGDLVFHDTRSALPPFGKSLHIHPNMGDIVLFPGYILHSVEPMRVNANLLNLTVSKQYRISVSFNFQGNWDTMSDVNAGYYTTGNNHL
jgi:hypothetical protein